MKRFSNLAYDDAASMVFGTAMHPVRCGFELAIGDGLVLPEVNYTLPTMNINDDTLPDVLKQYEQMVNDILRRAVTLQVPGVVLEFEHPPQLTYRVETGAEVTALTKRLMQQAYEEHGLKSALRTTICDIRDEDRPPRMRSGGPAEIMFESFEKNARAGADMLSIESTGGKEVTDKALLEADIAGLLLGLGVLAPRDMHFLWRRIVEIATETKTVPAGDTACGFANTAMVLADRGYIPNVLAAVVRAMAAVRSLVAFEEGAVGPSKDCAYEGPVLKAITGFPISMEGKSSACAHFSHMGNIAAAVCDLWSNESVQNVKLLSGFAPEVFTEILAYDCRLMNESLKQGKAKWLVELLVGSDEQLSMHAFIISPPASVALARAIVAETDDFKRARRAGLTACQLLRQAAKEGRVPVPEREQVWLDRIEEDLTVLSEEEQVLEKALPYYQDVLAPVEYGLE